jgi:hypothetical protein
MALISFEVTHYTVDIAREMTLAIQGLHVKIRGSIFCVGPNGSVSVNAWMIRAQSRLTRRKVPRDIFLFHDGNLNGFLIWYAMRSQSSVCWMTLHQDKIVFQPQWSL